MDDSARKILSIIDSLQNETKEHTSIKKLEDLNFYMLNLLREVDDSFEEFWEGKTVTHEINDEGEIVFSLCSQITEHYKNFLTINYKNRNYKIGRWCPWRLRRIIERSMSKIHYEKNIEN